MICQNCGKENPPDSKFCNNCGARLAVGEGQPPEAGPQPPPPTEEPEERDWGDGVPDWLKGDEQRLPDAGDHLDLPTWLLDDDAGNDVADTADTTRAESAGGQDLPEWLRGLAPTGTGPLPSNRGESGHETPSSSLDDWLADLDEPDEAAQASSWLSGIEAEEGDAAAEGWPDELRDDWLGDLDIGDYGSPARDATDDDWGSAGQSGFDMDEWLAELEPDEQRPEARQPEPPQPEPPQAEEPVEDTDVPDWLKGEAEAAPPAGAAHFDALEAIPDWLADLETEEDPAGEPEVTEEDWFASGEDEWPDEKPPVAEASITAWLAEPPAPEPPESALESVADEGPPAEADAIQAPELDWWPAGEEAPDWLMVDDTPAEAEEAAGPADDAQDWLSELDAAIGELEAASQETAPDTAETAQEPETGEAEEVEWPPADEGILPPWLADTELRNHLDEVVLEGPDKAQAVASAGEEAEDAPESGEPAGVMPDWLQELEAAAPAAELMDDVALPEWLQEAAPAAAEEENAPSVAEEQEPLFEAVPEDEDEDELLPEWLVEVTAAEPADEIAETDRWLFEDEGGEESLEVDAILGGQSGQEIVGADELPDWLGDVVSADAGELPPYLEDAETMPRVLAGPDLPGWLEDSLPDEERAEPTPAEELPPWLVPPVGAEAAQPEPLAEVEDSGEWAGVLGELAGSEASGAELTAAEIPEWLEALKPQEELRVSEAAIEDAEPVAEGPLAGLRGAVPVMPIVAETRSAEYVGEPEVSTEQQEQAELLRQLVRQEPQEVSRVVPGAVTQARPSPWLRLMLTILLFAAVLAGLFLPGLIAVETTPVLPIAPATEALEAAAGRPVLVVFDYTPAYAGILNDQANVLLQALAAQGSPVVYASQSAAGLGLGATAVAAVEGLQVERLGYIAGETVGLRRLARCLGAELPGARACEAYPPATGEAAAILLLTGERDSLVDWIEQVEAVGDAPLIAGVTEALLPVAAPYYATSQIDGVLAGQAATAALAQASGVETAGASPLPLALAAWLVAALLLAGNIIFFFIGLVGSRRTRKA